MIVVSVFLSILNQMELHLVQNGKEKCHHDHIPFNLKGNGNIVFSLYDPSDTSLLDSIKDPLNQLKKVDPIKGLLKSFQNQDQYDDEEFKVGPQ